MTENLISTEKNPVQRVIEIVLRITLLFLLLYWCYGVVKPFFDIIIWSVIFAVALYPPYNWLQEKLKGRKKLAAILIVMLMLLILLLPGALFAQSLYQGISFLKTRFESSETLIPNAPENIKSWPVIGAALYEKWNLVSNNITQTVTQYAPQIKSVLMGLVSSAASAGFAFVKFILSLLISGVVLINSEKASQIALSIFNRLMGIKGTEFVYMAENTIRTVVKGILGVAFIQSFLFGLGMIVVGVPAAGLWAILSLIFGIIQVGIFPVSIPVMIYVISTNNTTTWVLFIIWSIIISPLDNILKPILLGRGAVVPMAVIFIGAIGGFINSGLAGLFTGAIIFSVGYKLFMLWLDENKPEKEIEKPGEYNSV